MEKKVLCNFYLQLGIHANFIVCIPTNDKEAPEIANLRQTEHNKILRGSVIIY